MIPNNQIIATVDNRLDGNKYEMGIDIQSLPHLMDLLTNMYSDTEMACLREYSTNADDAHRDAKQTRPIEVTTPSPLSPYLRIKDWGIGLNETDIKILYSQYGKSTKRAQTDTNGSMGIGGKAALAYTNSFSLIGIKDGVKIHVSISRTATGAGVMEVVDETFVDDPNGVEIVIPAKKDNNFETKADRLFRFWAPGTVILNGKAPKYELTKVTDRIYTFPRETDGSGYYASTVDYIVMGGVGYPVKGGLDGYDLHSDGRSRESIVAFVTMNSPDEVVFTPSREALNYTPQTNKVVDELRKEYRAAILKQIQDAFTTEAKTFSEAYRLYIKFEKKYDRALLRDVKFRGQALPQGHIYKSATQTNYSDIVNRTVWHPNRSRNSVDTRSNISYLEVMNGLVVLNYNSASNGVSSTHKAKTRQYRAENDIDGNVIFLEDAVIPGAPWTDDATSVEWEDISKIRLVPQGYSNYTGKSYGGGYDVMNAKGDYEIRMDLTAKDEIVYFSDANGSVTAPGGTQIALIKRYLPSYLFVEAKVNRHEKLKRLFPRAITVNEAMVKLGRIITANLTQDDLDQLKYSDIYGLDYLDRVPYNEISDPELRRALELRKAPTSQSLIDFKTAVKGTSEGRALMTKIGSPKISDVHRTYPLIAYGHPKDNLIFINAKYATTLLPKGN